MTMKLTREAYEKLIEQNIAALPESMPNLEREHIIMVLRDSVIQHYEVAPRLDERTKRCITMDAALAEHKEKLGNAQEIVAQMYIDRHSPDLNALDSERHIDKGLNDLVQLLKDFEDCWPAREVEELRAELSELRSRLEKTENQNRFLRSWIRELREDGADAVSVDPLYGMLRDRITELAKEDPAADSPEGARLTALADLCEAYEKRRGESAVGAPEVNSKSRLKRVAMQRGEDSGVERQT